MHIVAVTVHSDEPCWGLWEGPKRGRWIQRVFVIRDDAVAKYEVDLGSLEFWPDATEIMYPSFGENSVGQLQEMAEADRHSDKWAKHRQRVAAESTLIPDILRDEEIKLDVIANRSNFGPGVSVQRNDFPREATNNKLKEKRNAARKSRTG